jgi:hypothetical protein
VAHLCPLDETDVPSKGDVSSEEEALSEEQDGKELAA